MPRRRRKRRHSRGLLRWLGWLVLAFVVITWTPILLLRWLDPPVTAFMLQYEDRTQGRDSAYRYQWLDWSQLGSAAPLAVLAAEDQRFPHHFGFDLGAIQDAVMGSLNGGGLRGASTISQQVAKNLFLWPGRSFLRKGLEAYLTALIELSWSKRRILEVYLNVAEFGRGIYGVPAAAETYFRKSPAQLTPAEAALLAAVLPSPKRLSLNPPSDYVRERQQWIMTQSEHLRRAGWLETLR